MSSGSKIIVNTMAAENSKTESRKSLKGGGIIFSKYLNACLNDNSPSLKRERSKKSDSDEKTAFELRPDLNLSVEAPEPEQKEISIPSESAVVGNEEDCIEKYFSKFYEFKILSTDRRLPNVSEFFAEEKWKVKELQDLKFRLNEVKGQLDNFDLSDWHRHTKSMNKAAEVQKYIRKHIEPELLTQAWCKFYEVVASTCLIPRKAVDDSTLNSVHLCEAPGAFVTSLNHYLKSKHPFIMWNWFASTLNPYHEQNPHSCMINDDRLIYNTIDKWDFGKDCTGDLFNLSNMRHLVDKTKDYFNGDVLLVTSDGSFDCQSSPGEQETMVAPLLYCEAITAISVLKPGGSYLLKMFTMFECETVCLLYLLYTLFGQVRVFKPVTSKEGNSEVYVMCLYFNPPDNFGEVHNALISYYGFDITKKAMFGRDKIPDEFMTQLKECASFFEKHQENVINSNVKLFHNISEFERDEIKSLQDNIAKEYVRRYQLSRVPSFNYIVNHHQMKITPMLNMDARMEEGSFSDQQKRSELDLNIKLELIQRSINDIESRWRFDRNMLWLVISGEKPVFSGINVGLPVCVVNNSKFCSGRLLKAYNETVELLGPICTKSDNRYSHPAMNICDVSNKPWSIKTWVAQKESLKDIMEVLAEMEDNSCLLLNGLPLLTQFNVGLVYLLGHAFEQVGFTNPKKSGFSVFFKGLNKKYLEYINVTFLQPIRQLNSNYKEAVLSFFPIKNLCDDPVLYKVIVSTNHICLKKIINRRIEESLSL